MKEINKIYTENCLDTMARMEDNFIDLTVTSPPYDGLRTYNGYSFDFESVAKELFRITKDGGVVVWIVGDATIKGSESGTSFKQALFLKECGFNLHDTMIWYKKAKFPHHENSKRYKPQFEYMFVFSKGEVNRYNPIYDVLNESYGKELNIKCKIKTKNNGKFNGKIKKVVIKKHRMRDNVWEVSQKGFKGHPAPFPEQLANDHIVSWSNENDLVYDPFMGSGTTAKMAILNNRNYIGSEISKDYVEIANKRLTTYLTQTKIF
jgi:DNA modification methylase